MADTKISAMTAALQVANLDEIPIVNAGANFKATRALILTSAATENIEVLAQAGNFAILGDDSGFNFFAIDNAGGANISTTGVFQCIAASGPNTSTLTADPTIPAASWICNFPIVITYIPGAPLNWAIPVPTDLAVAIDRLAAAVVARTVGGPV